MKNVNLLFIVFSLMIGCSSDKNVTTILLKTEERLALNQPDSAKNMLEHIKNATNLSISDFARWSLLHAEVCHQLGEDPPFIYEIERAKEYYDKYGSPIQQAKSLLYLGYSLEEEEEFDRAMRSYLSAERLAKEVGDYKLAGKICSQAAGLYDLEDNFDETKRLHRKAADYYLLAKDSLDYVYALRDIGMVFLENEELEKSLECCFFAYKFALKVADSLQLSSLANRIGIIYQEMDSLSLSEQYLFQSIAYKEEGSAPTYLALSDLFMKRSLYDKAYEYANKAESSKTSNEMTKGGLLYLHYLMEKNLGNYTKSLDFYEKYVAFADSISDLQENANTLKVEKRYNHLKLSTDNYVLQIRNQRVVLVCILLAAFCLFMFFLYRFRIALKNKRIVQQQQMMRVDHVALLEKEFILKGLEDNIQQIRENILKNSSIWKRVIANSQNVELAKTKPIAKKEWMELIETVKMTYILFYENLRSHFPGLTDDEIVFCILLKIGLDSQQLSILLNIQPTSVSHKRYRIMKKGRCENTNTTLEEILQKF